MPPNPPPAMMMRFFTGCATSLRCRRPPGDSAPEQVRAVALRARQVVRDLEPRRLLRDERVRERPPSGIAVDGPEAEAHGLGIGDAAAPDGRPAYTAEAAVLPGRGLVLGDVVAAA